MRQVPLERDNNIVVNGPFLVRNLHQQWKCKYHALEATASLHGRRMCMVARGAFDWAAGETDRQETTSGKKSDTSDFQEGKRRAAIMTSWEAGRIAEGKIGLWFMSRQLQLQ